MCAMRALVFTTLAAPRVGQVALEGQIAKKDVRQAQSSHTKVAGDLIPWTISMQCAPPPHRPTAPLSARVVSHCEI